MTRLPTDAALLREIEETPTQPTEIRYIVNGDQRKEIMAQVRRLEAEGRLYLRKWHGITVYGVNWYPQQGTTDGSAAA